MRAVLLITVLFGTTAFADTPIDERTEADPNGRVEISNVAGTVEIEGWDRDEVHLTGRLGEGTERLEFERDGTLVRINVRLPKKSHRHVDDTDLVVNIPEGSRLSVTTVSAEIEVRGVEGSQRLQSVSGDIETRAMDEDIEVKTVSGDVTVEGRNNSALLTLTTVSGDIMAEDIAGELVATVVSGDIEVVADELERARIKTTNGDVDLVAGLPKGARFEVATINGDLEIEFRGKVDAEFEIETFNGSIDNCFGPDPVRTSKYAPGKELRFVEGDGAARVLIKTLNGGINLCRD
ncbi:MAG: DUF4097 family beta strand repeat-containing protein [Gammaproteobacteria bacterium]|jgi:DUF4097 and DUF4098 domain-containing protein YvlB